MVGTGSRVTCRSSATGLETVVDEREESVGRWEAVRSAMFLNDAIAGRFLDHLRILPGSGFGLYWC